ncbi:MAG: hypothetical protein ACREKE_02065 [bacterium]
MPKDEETSGATAREMQEDQPQWYRNWWARLWRGRRAVPRSMPEDENTPGAVARKMQEDRPQWRSIRWEGPKRGYMAMHGKTGQIIFANDPETLNRMMDQVEGGAWLDNDWWWNRRRL